MFRFCNEGIGFSYKNQNWSRYILRRIYLDQFRFLYMIWNSFLFMRYFVFVKPEPIIKILLLNAVLLSFGQVRVHFKRPNEGDDLIWICFLMSLKNMITVVDCFKAQYCRKFSKKNRWRNSLDTQTRLSGNYAPALIQNWCLVSYDFISVWEVNADLWSVRFCVQCL